MNGWSDDDALIQLRLKLGLEWADRNQRNNIWSSGLQKQLHSFTPICKLSISACSIVCSCCVGIGISSGIGLKHSNVWRLSFPCSSLSPLAHSTTCTFSVSVTIFVDFSHQCSIEGSDRMRWHGKWRCCCWEGCLCKKKMWQMRRTWSRKQKNENVSKGLSLMCHDNCCFKWVNVHETTCHWFLTRLQIRFSLRSIEDRAMAIIDILPFAVFLSCQRQKHKCTIAANFKRNCISCILVWCVSAESEGNNSKMFAIMIVRALVWGKFSGRHVAPGKLTERVRVWGWENWPKTQPMFLRMSMTSVLCCVLNNEWKKGILFCSRRKSKMS